MLTPHQDITVCASRPQLCAYDAALVGRTPSHTLPMCREGDDYGSTRVRATATESGKKKEGHLSTCKSQNLRPFFTCQPANSQLCRQDSTLYQRQHAAHTHTHTHLSSWMAKHSLSRALASSWLPAVNMSCACICSDGATSACPFP